MLPTSLLSKTLSPPPLPSVGAASVGVLIPAHNGAETIARSLGSLVNQAFTGHLDAVVVCNGCEDSTEARARAWDAAFSNRGWRLRVIRSRPGRISALTAGEAVLHDPSVIAVVDQDAALSENALQDLCSLLSERGKHFAAPQLSLPPSHGLVGRYYRAWQSVPYVRAAPVTIGCYAISARGQDWWSHFPPDVPDDQFVRLHFEPCERAVASAATYEVLPPSDVRALLRARRGYAQLNRSLAVASPGLATRARRERRAGLTAWAINPRHWVDAALVCAIHTCARLLTIA